MKTIKMYTEDQLENMTMKEITDHNNEVCKETGVPGSKRFSTKPLAINRAIKNQKEYLVLFEGGKKNTKKPIAVVTPKTEKPKTEKKAKVEKSKGKPKKVDRDLKISIVTGTPTEGSTEHFMYEVIEANMGIATIGEMLAHVKTNYKRPSGQSIDDKLILRRMRKAINNGHLKIEK